MGCGPGKKRKDRVPTRSPFKTTKRKTKTSKKSKQQTKKRK